MAICKFFLEGTCRFGESCKFEHAMPRTEHSYTNPQSILLQNKTGTNNVDTAQIVKAVINDMVSAERGGQWILSSYAPYKDKGPFPGFEDFSMEEIRLMFYQARASNTLDQHKQQVQGLLQQAMMKIRLLQNPSQDIINMLRSIYNAAPVNLQQQQQQQQFAAAQPGASSSSIFGAAGANLQQKSIFGSPPHASNPSIFGGGGAPAQSVFGSPTSTPSVFGGTTPSNPPAFIAATNAQQSIFGGNPQVGSSIFGGGGGGSTQQTTSNSIFGGGNTTTSSIFAASQPGLGGAANPNPFGGAAPQQAANNAFASPLQSAPVATAHSNSIFGQSTQVQPPQYEASQPPQYEPPKPQMTQQHAFNIMQQNARGGFFPSQLAPQNAQQAFEHSNNIFGNLVQQQQQQQQQQQLSQQQQQHQQLQVSQQQPLHNNDNPFISINDNNYSKPEDLTPAEIAWFQSDNLDVTEIPIKPPTREMCF